MPPKKDQLPEKHFRIALEAEQLCAVVDLVIEDRGTPSAAARADEARQSLKADSLRGLRPRGARKVEPAPPCP